MLHSTSLPHISWLLLLIFASCCSNNLLKVQKTETNYSKGGRTESEKQLKSAAMDFLILNEYEKTFALYQNIEFYQNSVKYYKKNITYKQMVGNFSDPFINHCLHFQILGTKSISITELLVALHTKFLSFLTGMTYLNCRHNVGITDRISFSLDKICEMMSADLIQFSEFELKLIIRRLFILLNQVPKIDLQIMKPIRQFARSASKFHDKYFYKFTYTRLFEQQDEHYQRLTNDEVVDIGREVSNLQKLYEGIKFGPGLQHLRYEEDFPLKLEVVTRLWEQKKIIIDPLKSQLWQQGQNKPDSPYSDLNKENAESCKQIYNERIKEFKNRKKSYIINMIREHIVRKLKLFPRNLLYSLAEENRLRNTKVDMFQIVLISSPKQPENCFINSVNPHFYNLTEKFFKNLSFRTFIQSDVNVSHLYFLH